MEDSQASLVKGGAGSGREGKGNKFKSLMVAKKSEIIY